MQYDIQKKEKPSTTSTTTSSTTSYPTTIDDDNRTTTASNTSTSIDTEPGVSNDRYDKIRLLRTYNKVLGDMPSQVGWYLTELMEIGMEVDVIINAINETAWARHPSPRYMRCILDRYRENDILTMRDLNIDKLGFQCDKEASKDEWWH